MQTKDTQPIAANAVPNFGTDRGAATELKGLNDHLLRDIGLSRVDVELMSGDIFRMMR